MPIPIIIGVGDFKNPSIKPEDAKEPASLMLSAINAAIHDTGIKNTKDLQTAIDDITVVRTWSWPYTDLPALLAQQLGTKKLRHSQYTDHGGHSPARILDETARRISCGEVRVGIIVGGEALASSKSTLMLRGPADGMVVAACMAQGQFPPKGWTPTTEDLSAASALNLEKSGSSE